MQASGLQVTVELGLAFETTEASGMKGRWGLEQIAPRKAAVLGQVSELEEFDQEQACDLESLVELEEASGWSLPIQASELRWGVAQEPASEMGSAEPTQASVQEPAFGMRRRGHLKRLAED